METGHGKILEAVPHSLPELVNRKFVAGSSFAHEGHHTPMKLFRIDILQTVIEKRESLLRCDGDS
jgi:hypothetical protein